MTSDDEKLRLEYNSREGDGHYKTNGALILCSVMSIFSGQNIRKLRDMKPLTNEMKRSKRKTTIYVIKEFAKNCFFNAYTCILFFPCEMEINSNLGYHGNHIYFFYLQHSFYVLVK